MRSLLNWIFSGFCRLVELSPEEQKKLTEARGQREVLLAMVELKKRGITNTNVLDIHGELKALGLYTKMPTIVDRCNQLVSLGFVQKLGRGSHEVPVVQAIINEAFVLSDNGLRHLGLSCLQRILE